MRFTSRHNVSMSSRRRFLRASLAAAGAWTLDAGSVARLLAQPGCQAALPAGELIDTLPLTGDRHWQTPYGEVLGGPGLETRVFTDLSRLTPERLITPAHEVFIRTAVPPGVKEALPTWAITLTGPGGSRSLGIDALRRAARPMGAHLIECAGNNNPDNFGLLSVAEWTGVPLTEVVQEMPRGNATWGLLVTGEDHEASARSSVPGASWVIPLDALPRLGAFLATEMNGAALTLDHGAPVRLVVPGWYGCAWIKWVREIALVGPDEPATTQMLEFSRRTHQDGLPARARDYEAPVIDLAATPIRVERRRVNGAIQHHVIGIVWGGATPVSTLEIRFNVRDAWKPLDLCPPPTSTRAWSLWTHRWTPTEPGIYNIALRCPDPTIRTRRLDLFFYARRVRIDDV
jgi:DMSO/TMAO reductase YedYZ molybdopterin-dependent catalytic subunit